MKLGGMLVLTAALTLTGCAHEPPPVSEKVQAYYENPPTPTVAAAEPIVVTSLEAINARIADDQPLTVSVLGDSTGNDDGEWVELWAQDLAAEATVTVHRWKEGSAQWPKATYGDGARQITIWNGSHPGSSSAYGRGLMAKIQPAKPDLVIYNYGHNPSVSGIISDVEAMQRNSVSRWGNTAFAVTLQNAARGSYETATTEANADLKAWAEPQGVPVIDVASVINAGNLDALLLDDVHPNKQGSRVWADKVAEVLG